MSNWTRTTKRLVKVDLDWIDPVAVEAITRFGSDARVRLSNGHTVTFRGKTPDEVAHQLFTDTSREDQS